MPVIVLGSARVTRVDKSIPDHTGAVVEVVLEECVGVLANGVDELIGARPVEHDETVTLEAVLFLLVQLDVRDCSSDRHVATA